MGITSPLTCSGYRWTRPSLGREVLTRLYGGQPYSADGTKVTYNSDAGVKALQFLTNGQPSGGSWPHEQGQDAFKAGKADDHRWLLSVLPSRSKRD